MSGFYGELAEAMGVVAACLPKLRSTDAGIQSARSWPAAHSMCHVRRRICAPPGGVPQPDKSM